MKLELVGIEEGTEGISGCASSSLGTRLGYYRKPYNLLYLTL